MDLSNKLDAIGSTFLEESGEVYLYTPTSIYTLKSNVIEN